MDGNRVRTANYPAQARARLGEAALKARLALNLSRPQLVAAAAKLGIVLNKKSLELVESGQPGVGQTFLYALGRFLPNWTEDTARVVLEGGDVPPTTTSLPTPGDSQPAPYEFSAEARARMISMTMREVLTFVEHELISRGEEAADRAFDEIARVRREAHLMRLGSTPDS